MRDKDNAVSKAGLIRLMANELTDNVKERESQRSPLGTYPPCPGYYKSWSGCNKYQILDDIRKLRRCLNELSHIIEREL